MAASRASTRYAFSAAPAKNSFSQNGVSGAGASQTCGPANISRPRARTSPMASSSASASFDFRRRDHAGQEGLVRQFRHRLRDRWSGERRQRGHGQKVMSHSSISSPMVEPVP